MLAGRSLLVCGWAADAERRSACPVRVCAGGRRQRTHPMDRADAGAAIAPGAPFPAGIGFIANLVLPAGIHRVAVEAQMPGGDWVVVHRLWALRLPGVRGTRPAAGSGAAAADEPGAWTRFTQGTLCAHVNAPRNRPVVVVTGSCFVSGWAADLEAGTVARARVVIGAQPHALQPANRHDVRRMLAHAPDFPLDTGFAGDLHLPVGLHRLAVEIDAGGGEWIAVRRVVVLCVPWRPGGERGVRGLDYGALVRLEARSLEKERPDVLRHLAVMADKPSFAVVVDARDGTAGLDRTLQSLRAQLHGASELRWLGEAGEAQVALAAADATPLAGFPGADISAGFVVYLRSGEELAPNALYEFARAAVRDPAVDIVYGDEDARQPSGARSLPFRKPGWSPDTLESFDYIGFVACIRASVARDCPGASHRYDLLLRATERTTRVAHVPEVLGHAPSAGAGPGWRDVEAMRGRLERTGRRGTVEPHPAHPGCHAIRLDLARKPRVSVVVSTAGAAIPIGGKPVVAIAQLVEQLRAGEGGDGLEIVIVDDGRIPAALAAALERAGCLRVNEARAGFNLSASLNRGAARATGEMLLFLHDDVAAPGPAWLARLLEPFEKPHVGVAGARLLRPDGTLQHAGLVHAGGRPVPVRQGFPGDEAGYRFSTCAPRNFAAVSGACLMTTRRLFEEAGGFDERYAAHFADADFCQKARERGRSVVYAPGAVLVHFEAGSRSRAGADADGLAYERRWAPVIASDEFYNERFLSVAPPTFEPCVNPRML